MEATAARNGEGGQTNEVIEALGTSILQNVLGVTVTCPTTPQDDSLSNTRMGNTACEVWTAEYGNSSHFKSQALPVAPREATKMSCYDSQ